MLGIKKNIVLFIVLFEMISSFAYNQTDTIVNGFLWKRDEGDSIYHLKSLVIENKINTSNNNLINYIDYAIFSKMGVKKLKIEEFKPYKEIKLLENDDYFFLEISYDSIQNLKSDFCRLVSLFDYHLKNEEKNIFVEKDTNNRVHAFGYLCKKSNKKRLNMLLYIDFKKLPNVLDVNNIEYYQDKNVSIKIKIWSPTQITISDKTH